MALESSTKEDLKPEEGIEPKAAEELTDATAESSPAETQAGEEGASKDAKEPTILDKIEEITAKRGEEQSSSSEEGSQDQKADDKSGLKAEANHEPDAEGAEEAKDDDAKLPFHKHPRWQEVKGQLKTAEEDRDKYKTSHESYVEVQNYMTQANLNVEEVNTGFTVMNLIKNDPAKALEALEPIVAQLKEASGATLPPDIQKQVEDGFVDESVAQELAQLRADKVRYTENQALQNQQRETDQAASVQNNNNVVIKAINDWEKQWSETDPDYQKKLPMARQALENAVFQNGGLPPTPQEALKLAHDARIAAEAQIEAFLPKQKPRAQMPVTAGGAGSAKAAPKTIMEVIDNVTAG